MKLKGNSKKLDLSGAVKYFRHCVTKSGIDRGWMNEGMVLKADYKKRRQILEDMKGRKENPGQHIREER